MFNINSIVNIKEQSAHFDDSRWAEWISKNAPEFSRRRHAMGILPGRLYTILAKGPHWDNEKENLYLCSAKRSSFVIVVPEQELIPVENTKSAKETKIMDRSKDYFKALSSRQAFVDATKLVMEKVLETGTKNPKELTLEQIIKRVNEYIVKGDIVRIINLKCVIIDGVDFFDDDISGLVRYYPYMTYPRKNITGEVIKCIPDKENDIYVIRDYKGRVWLVSRSGVDRVKGE